MGLALQTAFFVSEDVRVFEPVFLARGSNVTYKYLGIHRCYVIVVKIGRFVKDLLSPENPETENIDERKRDTIKATAAAVVGANYASNAAATSQYQEENTQQEDPLGLSKSDQQYIKDVTGAAGIPTEDLDEGMKRRIQAANRMEADAQLLGSYFNDTEQFASAGSSEQSQKLVDAALNFSYDSEQGSIDYKPAETVLTAGKYISDKETFNNLAQDTSTSKQKRNSFGNLQTLYRGVHNQNFSDADPIEAENTFSGMSQNQKKGLFLAKQADQLTRLSRTYESIQYNHNGEEKKKDLSFDAMVGIWDTAAKMYNQWPRKNTRVLEHDGEVRYNEEKEERSLVSPEKGLLSDSKMTNLIVNTWAADTSEIGDGNRITKEGIKVTGSGYIDDTAHLTAIENVYPEAGSTVNPATSRNMDTDNQTNFKVKKDEEGSRFIKITDPSPHTYSVSRSGSSTGGGDSGDDDDGDDEIPSGAGGEEGGDGVE